MTLFAKTCAVVAALSLLAAPAGASAPCQCAPAVAVAAPAKPALAVPTRSTLGINLADIGYLRTERPFINVLKSAGQWDSAGVVNAAGYPQVGTPSTQLMFPVQTGAQYWVINDGVADISIVGCTKDVASSLPGQALWTITKAGATRVQLRVANVTQPITRLAVVRVDHLALYQQGQVFNPDFLAFIRQFSAVRFMDWGATNNSTLVNWADRPQVNDLTWEEGAPIEVMVSLASQARVNMWYNLPFSASDDFVSRAADYIDRNLGPGLSARIEDGNEMSNYAFQQTKDAQSLGQAKWGATVAYPNLRYYGFRAAQVARLVNAQSHHGRLLNILSLRGQFAVANSGSYGPMDALVQGVADAGVGTVQQLFDRASMWAPYYGPSLPDEQATVLAMAKAHDLDGFFALLRTTGGLSVANRVASMQSYAAVAADPRIALPLDAYESGKALTYSSFAAADQPVVSAFYYDAIADPRMGAWLAGDLIAGWKANSPNGLLMQYDDMDQGSSSGIWGAKRDLYAPDTPELAVMLAS